MQVQKAAEVVFDCVVRGLERKLAGPTTNFMERVLDEVGLEGVWALKDARQIRKRGRERFSTIRVESRGGASSVRIWCKPLGNDTAFEYSLYPPKDTDANSAYVCLSRIHPATLKISKPPQTAVEASDRLVHVKPIGKLVRETERPEAREDDAVDSNTATGRDEMVRTGDAGVQPLALDPSWELCAEEAVDRALMAIAFVAEGGYAKKSEASASIIENLDIKGFSGGASDSYTSVEGSMRSITMALWKRKRYIERILANSRNGGGPSDSVRGYMITPKGERRLESLMEAFGPEVTARMNPSWRRPAGGVSHSQVAAALSPSVPRSLSELKELVASHDAAERQVREIEDLVSLVESDLDSLRSELGSLDAEIARINELKAEMSKRIALKEGERREWEQMKALHEAEKIRLEGLMGVRNQA
jgi:hypothetical protein